MTYGLENPEYITNTKKDWSTLPSTMTVIEYSGTGDGFFGGDADDRPMGLDGCILEQGYELASVACFKTIEDAHQAALKIPNRRPNTILGVGPRWDC